MSQLPTLEAFDCDGDSNSVGSRWEKWKRAFEIYLLAASIDTPVKKRATLLHTGGLPLQEIYHNIPGAHIAEADGVDVYNNAIQKLDEYFSPKQSFVYERHVFRLINQQVDEKFEKFLIRLRHQAAKCNFAKQNDDIIDQVTEKCTSAELRKKILLLGDDVTIEKIISEANSLETVDRQLNEFKDKQSTVNRVMARHQQNECTRCGSKYHAADSNTCPAKSKPCRKCGLIGHFMSRCRTRNAKRKNVNAEVTNSSKKYKWFKKDSEKSVKPKESSKDTTSSTVDYIFHIDDDAVIICQVGKIDLEMLIDSGSKCNIITDRAWEFLKGRSIQACNQQKSTDKVLYAYGSTTPLEILGSFETSISAGPESTNATFYVIKDGTRNLLGKETALALKVLKLGVSVNNTIENSSFPKFKDIQLEIAIDTTVKPVCQPNRRVPIPLEGKINNKIDELLQMDIIEPVNKPSAWVSPVVPVLKGDGDVRLCVDMRCANKAIVRENHPLPTMDQLIPKFRKATVFSKLDIKNAFHQIELKENSRYITTFITSKGLFRYKRLMFGMSCAPEHFQKTLERVLLPCEGVVNFIDDIVTFGNSEEEHKQRLKCVLDTLKSNNVLLNEKKCIFNAKCIHFLGHELSSEGIKPLDKYVDSIKRFREPKTIDEVQSFLGLVTYIGKWIPNLATLTEPIRQILRQKLSKHADITGFWGSNQQIAFNELKRRLGDVHSLGYYDPNDRTQVVADASPVGLGAILIQFDSKGPRVIAYGNKSLTDVEKRYCQTEKEALALVWAVEHFNMYLYGLKVFELVTDHKPLEVIFGPRSKSCARIERWVLRLQTYNYKVIYRPGKSNLADPLSRLCVNSISSPFDDEFNINQIVQLARPNAVSLEEIKIASQADSDFVMVERGIREGNWDVNINNYRLFQNELWLHDTILLRGTKIVIPTSLRQRILAAAHEGHPGIVAMKARLRTKVWWPKIDKDAETMVKCCKGCTVISGPNPPAPMKRREMPSQAWLDIAVDFLGPLPSGDYLFVVIDYYSRYKEIKVMRSITSQETINVLKEIFSRLGIPASITADNGKQFTSQDFKAFCSESGIRVYFTIPYWPQQNGEVERQNRDILKRLKISQAQKSNWKNDLLDYLTMYNSTPHSTTGKSPSELFFNRIFRDKIPSVIDIEHGVIDPEAQDKDIEMKNKGKINEDRKRKAKDVDINIGEKVYVKNATKENKLSSDYNTTPHTVTSTNGSDIHVRNDMTGQEYRRNVIHLKKIEGSWKVCDKDSREEKQDSEDHSQDLDD